MKIYTLEKVTLFTSFCHRFCFYEINGFFGFFHKYFDSFTLLKLDALLRYLENVCFDHTCENRNYRIQVKNICEIVSKGYQDAQI